MTSLIIKTFRATDEPELCKRYIKKYSKTLQGFDLECKKNNIANFSIKSSVYAILLVDKYSKNVLGGCRLHTMERNSKLPISDLIPTLDHNLQRFIKPGICEMCGLFLAKEARRKVYFNQLFIKTIELAKDLKFKEVVGLASRHSLKTSKRFGFYQEKSVGEMGTFNYPTKEEKSYFMRLNLSKIKIKVDASMVVERMN